MVLLIFAIWSHFLVQKSKANIQFLIDVGLLLLEVTSGAIDSSQLTLQGSAELHSLHCRCKIAQVHCTGSCVSLLLSYLFRKLLPFDVEILLKLLKTIGATMWTQDFLRQLAFCNLTVTLSIDCSCEVFLDNTIFRQAVWQRFCV